MRIPPGARILAIVTALLVASACDDGEQSLRRGERVTICHATGSASNPYVQERPDVDGILSAHDGHPRDIIPAFDYLDDAGISVRYPGKNLQLEDILNN